MDQPVNPDERDPSVTVVAAVSLVGGRRTRWHPPPQPAVPAGVAMAASPGGLEPSHCRRITGISAITTRPSGRCRPYRRHRL
jgi:hypothetical protein